MPKLQPSKAEKNRRRVKGLVNLRMTEEGWEADDVAKKMGISATTFYRRLDDPDTFTVGELQAIGLEVKERSR